MLSGARIIKTHARLALGPGSAPCSSSAFTTSVWPLSAAVCSAVQPSCTRRRANEAMSTRAQIMCWGVGRVGNGGPGLFRTAVVVATRAPLDSSNCTTARWPWYAARWSEERPSCEGGAQGDSGDPKVFRAGFLVGTALPPRKAHGTGTARAG